MQSACQARCALPHRAWCQLCCGRGLESIRTLFFSRHFLQKALPTLADPLPTGAVTQSMNREAIQQVSACAT